MPSCMLQLSFHRSWKVLRGSLWNRCSKTPYWMDMYIAIPLGTTIYVKKVCIQPMKLPSIVLFRCVRSSFSKRNIQFGLCGTLLHEHVIKNPKRFLRPSCMCPCTYGADQRSSTRKSDKEFYWLCKRGTISSNSALWCYIRFLRMHVLLQYPYDQRKGLHLLNFR